MFGNEIDFKFVFLYVSLLFSKRSDKFRTI